MDFAYLPDILAPQNVDIYSQVRVPILPTLDPSASTPKATFDEETVRFPKPIPRPKY